MERDHLMNTLVAPDVSVGAFEEAITQLRASKPFVPEAIQLLWRRGIDCPDGGKADEGFIC